jgi:cellulose synthase/poly-beta-1,6-N-acetylglucosamine synthase-like glycosyltransferase
MPFDHQISWILLSASLMVGAFLWLHPLASFVFGIRRPVEPISPIATGPEAKNRQPAKFGIIITAWKSGALVPPLVRSLLAQTHKDYHIFVVADQCVIDPEISAHAGISVLYPATALNSKTRAIDLALDHMADQFNAAVIFDPDNLASPQFLAEANKLWQLGFDVIQGKRVAKNAQNQIAQLDGMGEAYYNFVNRRVPFLLGGSSAVSGSGMVLSVDLYREILAEKVFQTDKVIPAEDKLLQVKAIMMGHRIAFAERALVYDEKITDGSQLERQRTRWLGSYFIYLPLGFELLAKGLLRGSIHWILFAIWFMFPPVVVLILSASLLTLLGLATAHYAISLGLIISILAFLINYHFAVSQMAPNIQMSHAVKRLPQFVGRLMRALLRIKETKKDFLATSNTHVLDLQDLDNQGSLSDSSQQDRS